MGQGKEKPLDPCDCGLLTHIPSSWQHTVEHQLLQPPPSTQAPTEDDEPALPIPPLDTACWGVQAVPVRAM